MSFIDFCSSSYGGSNDHSVGTLTLKNGSERVDIEFIGKFGAPELFIFEQYCTAGVFTTNDDLTMEYYNSHKDYAFYRAVLAAFTDANVNTSADEETEAMALCLADVKICKNIDKMLEKLSKGIVKRLHEIQDEAIEDLLVSKRIAFATNVIKDVCDLNVEVGRINSYIDSLGGLVETMKANNIDFQEVIEISKKLAGKSVESIAKSIIDINAKRQRSNKKNNGGE